ncbi:MAG: cell division protein ZipA C-terminal FtsZ-binding domain-containing protein [Pseudomonadota bacterium]
MEDLRWILLGLGALVLLGLYLFSRKRRSDALVPLGDELKHDPLEAAPVARRSEPHIEDITHWGDDGVGPVRRRSLEEDAIRPSRPSQRRTPRFGYEAAPRSTASQLPLDEVDPAPGPIPGTADRGVSPAKPAMGMSVQGSSDPHAPSAEPDRTLVMNGSREREQDEPTAAPAQRASGMDARRVGGQDELRASQAPGVVPIYLVARDPQGFAGTTLIDVFARHGFEFGEMDVYHHADARGLILFSLMNGVAPGTFAPATLPEQHTPALALFLRLPIPAQPGLVFEQFLDIAHRLAEELDATLLDERREALSSESIDRMREIALGE